MRSGVETKLDVYPGLANVFGYMYPAHSTYTNFHEDAIKGIGWLFGKLSL